MATRRHTGLKDFNVEEAKRLRKDHWAKKIQGTRRSRKKYLIEYKGGECCICGYDKCAAALVFHHLEPEKKSFTIGLAVANNHNLKDTLKEVDKTILLCHNCHSEVHQGLHDEFIINYQTHTKYSSSVSSGSIS